MSNFSWMAVVRLAAALAAACFFSTPSHAAALDQLRSFLTQTQSARGEFVQRLTPRPGAKVPASASGQFIFQRPGKFRWLYEKPYEQLIVADGQRLVMFDKDLNQVNDQEAAGVAAVEPRVDPVRLQRVRKGV